MPKMSVYNAIFGRNVGHASLSIISNNNSEVYISHRPKITNTEYGGKDKDNSKKYSLKGYSSKASPISFEEDCKNRKRKPDVEITIDNLNESTMLSYYKRYINNELPDDQSLYHIQKNNCCGSVINFIRQGLNCKEISTRCYKCNANVYQKTTNSYLMLGFAMSGIISIFIPFAIPILIILAALLLFVSIKDFLNIESNVSGLTKNFWSPVTLEILINRIRKHKKKNHNYICPRKERLGFINSLDWSLLGR